MKQLLLILCLLLAPALASAKPLVADLSRYRIEIDSNFTGTRLLLFGTRNDTGDVVVVVRGPEGNFIVRKKKRIAGIWINAAEQKFDNIPTFYSIAASRPLEQVHAAQLFSPLRIGFGEVIHGSGPDSFAPALLQFQQMHNLYSGSVQKVSFMGESLFKYMIPFPDNIPGGEYTADVYLFSDGQLSGMQSIPLHVSRAGFDALIYDFAHSHSILYGLFAVLLALGIGWGASSVMHRL